MIRMSVIGFSIALLLLLILSLSFYFILYPVEASRLFQKSGATLRESFYNPRARKLKGIRQCNCLPGFLPTRNDPNKPSNGYHCKNNKTNKLLACY